MIYHNVNPICCEMPMKFTLIRLSGLSRARIWPIITSS